MYKVHIGFFWSMVLTQLFIISEIISSPILVATEPLLYTMVAHTARGKWQGIGFFYSLCEKLANISHRSQTSDKLVTEHWQEPWVIPNTEATCINVYFPKRALWAGSVVGIATGYGLDSPGIEFRWGQDFPQLSRPALGPSQPPVQWVPGLSWGVKSGRGVMLTPHLILVPWSWNGTAIPLPPL